jgi:tRNA threonylcarbamoyladenosine biosynthesis protein TsaE
MPADFILPKMIQPQSEYIASKPEDLDSIADSFLQAFPVGGIFCISGEMGSGKTTFVHAICKKFGLAFAGSPTFSLVNEYLTSAGQTVLHFDLYRLKNLESALDIGFDEYLQRNGYLFIEWPEIVLPLLPDNAQSVTINVNGTARSIHF